MHRRTTTFCFLTFPVCNVKKIEDHCNQDYGVREIFFHSDSTYLKLYDSDLNLKHVNLATLNPQPGKAYLK